MCIVLAMSVPHAFLGLLNSGPQHGYALKHLFDTRFAGGRSLKFGQVYATLARLERDGLTKVATVEAGEGPDRKLHAITLNGMAELESWLAGTEPADQLTLGTIYTRVTVALLTGRPASGILEAQRQVHLAKMRELRRKAITESVERRLSIDYLIAHLQADLDWIELAGARVQRVGEGRT